MVVTSAWSHAALACSFGLLLVISVKGERLEKYHRMTASSMAGAWQQAWRNESLNSGEFIPKRTFVTMLTGDGGNYVQGLQALGASLQHVGTKYPLTVITTHPPAESVRAVARCLSLLLLQVPDIANPVQSVEERLARFASTYSKLGVWSLPCERVVWLDADTVVVQNIDALFSQPADGFGFAAARDCGVHCEARRFNSGVMAFEPSPSVFQMMFLQISSTPSYDAGDQGFLNEFFKDWPDDPKAHLEQVYNVLKPLETKPPFKAIFDNAKVIHCNEKKPWTGSEDDIIYPKSHGAWREAKGQYDEQCA
mmetsp:Transcript_54249/g.108039  ORF Transcript_54249/g.108039 Transcript_54249/m.108039 type:complete len:309 (+) Transcript_54249:116-1042(+)